VLTFLKLVAAFIVAIVVLVVAVILFIRWKLRRFLKKVIEAAGSQGSSAVPPFRIKLEPRGIDEETEWFHENDVKKQMQQFESSGFNPLGDFDVEGLPLQIRGYQHQDHQVYGVIYDHATAGVWSDVARRYSDETSWTVSSAKEHGMDAAPWHTPCFLQGQSVKELLCQLLESSPADGIQSAGADKFVSRFEAAYKREMNWRIERGGATEDEIRRICQKNGQDCTAEQVEQIQGLWKTAIGEFLSEQILIGWRKESRISSLEYDRISDRLVVIHKRLTPQQVLEASRCDSDDEDQDLDDEEDQMLTRIKAWCSAESSISAFQKLIEQKRAGARWKRIWDLKKPLVAEIWERIEPDRHDKDLDDDDDI
jgi:hypothetical protein